MGRQTITDHQLSGKQKVAITRTKDRSLRSLDSEEDRRIDQYLSEWISNWRSDARKAAERREAEKDTIDISKEIQSIEEDEKYLKMLQRNYDRLTKEIDEALLHNKKRVAENRRAQRNVFRSKIENLLKGKTRE